VILFCQDKRRRDRVLPSTLNGIDFIEVLGAPGCGTQLALTFLKDPAALGLNATNIQLTGDTTLDITGMHAPTARDPLTLTIALSGTGDFSRYTLTLITGGGNPDPPPGVDSQLASVSFSFKAGCPSPVDCLPTDCCPATYLAPPDIHYLARDYDGFRQAMLDRIAVLAPSWTETHPSDLGITMVETLAYAADRVSYLQDAVNTEAYIGTARSRISLRRHARLVDYFVQDGANARAWVCMSLKPGSPPAMVPKGTQIYPLVPGLNACIDPNSSVAGRLLASPGPVFESLEDTTLYLEQNQMNFYDWGDAQCCLPAGATQATLDGAFNTLRVGKVLIFQEWYGPLTGEKADADPTHRWAVRLTVASTTNHDGTPLTDPVAGVNSLTHIEWASADALPFPLCLSSVTDAAHGTKTLPFVSVALGNVVATDHGTWTNGESLGVVPPAPIAPVTGVGCSCTTVAGAAVPKPRYAPTLANPPLTFAVSYDDTAPASSFLAPNTSAAKPQISLLSDDGRTWQPVEDLLEENGEFTGFIPEIEWDGTPHLRFGDGTYGAAADAGLDFAATYRSGNGTAGNVGRDSLAHVLLAGGAISAVRNPIAAAGGVDFETIEHIRQVAPFSFETQLRCVTADDYGAMAAKLPGVSEAKGTIRWTGSWYTAFTSVAPVSAWTTALKKEVKVSLNLLRMMGTDLVVERAKFVGLRITLEICVGSDYFRGDVYAAILAVLVAGDTCAGTSGLLNATNFQFGKTVYSSPIIAAVQSVVGVVAVKLLIFERMDSPTTAGSAPPTQLTMGAIEIPRCDNDPNHTDRGALTLKMDGGK
jgi:hypothetical protein